MKKQIFAVCDLEAEYARNFMEYLNRKNNLPFEVQAFTSVESLAAYAGETHVELLLISSDAMCREVQELNIGKVVILTEGTRQEELDAYDEVYKYQSSAEILREVMACYGEEKIMVSMQNPVLRKDRDSGCVFSSGAMPQDLFCVDTRSDIKRRTDGALSEYGGIFRF